MTKNHFYILCPSKKPFLYNQTFTSFSTLGPAVVPVGTETGDSQVHVSLSYEGGPLKSPRAMRDETVLYSMSKFYNLHTWSYFICNSLLITNVWLWVDGGEGGLFYCTFLKVTQTHVLFYYYYFILQIIRCSVATVGTESLFRAKSLCCGTFAIDLKPFKLSQEPNFFSSSYSDIVAQIKLKKGFFFTTQLNMLLKKIRRFFQIFWRQ